MKSELNHDSFLERLKLIIGDEKPFSWASRIGISTATFSRILNDNAFPKMEYLHLIANKTGVSLNWLISGIGSPYPEKEPEPRPDDFAEVPNYDLAVAAGGGAVVEAERVKSMLAFRRDWIRRRLGMREQDLCVFHVTGESMEPLLRAGDAVLVNLALKRPQEGCIFLVRVGEGLVLKRVHLRSPDPGGAAGPVVQLASDNPAYPPFRLDLSDPQNAVIGQVVWFGRTLV